MKKASFGVRSPWYLFKPTLIKYYLLHGNMKNETDTEKTTVLPHIYM